MLRDVRSASGIHVQQYSENILFRNVDMAGTRSNCVQLTGPVRGLAIEDSSFRDCGDWGISEFGTAGFGLLPNEGIVLRRINITNVGAGNGSRDGVRFRGPVRWLTLDSVSVTNATGHGFVFPQGLADTVISESSVIRSNVRASRTPRSLHKATQIGLRSIATTGRPISWSASA